MRTLVTGAAGFIGSALTARLLGRGDDVLGVDALTSNYDPDIKRRNIARFGSERRFRFDESDIRTLDWDRAIEGVDAVFHLAAIPGVRASFDRSFDDYVSTNVMATHHLLAALLERHQRTGDCPRLVYASSSSVYGERSSSGPIFRESDPAVPFSPYGVTKLAAEHLLNVYASNFELPAIGLRLFTVYGPGQRPDMAIQRLIASALDGDEFPMFGDGSQIRDFTFVEDVVDAFIAASTPPPGSPHVLNVASAAPVTLADVIARVSDAVGKPPVIAPQAICAGDVSFTAADTTQSNQWLGWSARTSLEEGIRAQVERERSVRQNGG